MAGSRLSNFGTIFSRATGLMQAGALKETPLWYDVYRKYPPPVEPNSERPLPPQDPIPEIVYEEDYDRVQQKPRIAKVRQKGGRNAVRLNLEDLLSSK